jgi:hypothetical protein
MGCAAVSVDGFIANENDEVGPLFEWVSNGDTEWTWSGGPEEHALRSTRASVEFIRAVYPRIGCVVTAAVPSTSPTAGTAYRPPVSTSSW